MSKSELVIPSTPSFLVLNPQGKKRSCCHFDLQHWLQMGKSWRVHTNSPGHLKICLNMVLDTDFSDCNVNFAWCLHAPSQVFHSGSMTAVTLLWCQSPVLTFFFFKACHVVSSSSRKFRLICSFKNPSKKLCMVHQYPRKLPSGPCQSQHSWRSASIGSSGWKTKPCNSQFVTRKSCKLIQPHIVLF